MAERASKNDGYILEIDVVLKSDGAIGYDANPEAYHRPNATIADEDLVRAWTTKVSDGRAG